MRISKHPLVLIIVIATYIFTGVYSQLFAQDKIQAAHPFIVSGVIKNSNSAKILQDFSQYLSQHSDYPLKVELASSYTDLSRKMRNDPFAIAWTCGAPFIQDEKTDQQQLVAVPTFKNKPTYYSLVLTRSNTKHKTLADFKGGILAYSDPRSNTGYLSPKYALKKKNIDINNHFRLLINAGNHEGSIEAVIDGLADVTAVNEYIWETYTKAFPEAKKKLREIERLGPYPLTPIVASKNVSRTSIIKLQKALKNMKNTKQGKKILQAFNLDDFVEKKSEFYNPIREMLDEVDINSGI